MNAEDRMEPGPHTVLAHLRRLKAKEEFRSGMVERVAKILLDGPLIVNHAQAIEAARDVIETMREPTEAIAVAGAGEIAGFNREVDSASEEAVEAWQAMIDAALT